MGCLLQYQASPLPCICWLPHSHPPCVMLTFTHCRSVLCAKGSSSSAHKGAAFNSSSFTDRLSTAAAPLLFAAAAENSPMQSPPSPSFWPPRVATGKEMRVRSLLRSARVMWNDASKCEGTERLTLSHDHQQTAHVTVNKNASYSSPGAAAAAPRCPIRCRS